MATNENVEKAKSALETAEQNLHHRGAGGPNADMATAVALIGIGHALVAIAEGDQTSESGPSA